MVADVVDYGRINRVYGDDSSPEILKKSSPMTKACLMIIFLMVLYLIKRNRDRGKS
jgi:hypothetical protein